MSKGNDMRLLEAQKLVVEIGEKLVYLRHPDVAPYIDVDRVECVLREMRNIHSYCLDTHTATIDQIELDQIARDAAELATGF